MPELGREVAEIFHDMEHANGGGTTASRSQAADQQADPSASVPAAPGEPGGPAEPIAITGAALGLPGTDRVFDDDNVGRILSGEQFIDVIPRRIRRAMADKHITRLVKSEPG